jgi:hypothetical protein
MPERRSTLPVRGFEPRPELVVRRVRDRALEPELHRGKRRSELVGGVGDELTLGLDRALETIGHLVEGLTELLHLGAAAHFAGASREIALAESLGRGSQAYERTREGTGEPERQQHPGDERCDPDRDEAERDVANGCRSPVARSG